MFVGTPYKTLLEKARLFDERMNKMEKGDIVRLKSGGPRMTIKCMSDPAMLMLGQGDVFCSWFSRNSLEEGWFDSSQLVLVKNESPKIKRWFLTWENGDSLAVNAPCTTAAINLANQGLPSTIDEIDIDET